MHLYSVRLYLHHSEECFYAFSACVKNPHFTSTDTPLKHNYCYQGKNECTALFAVNNIRDPGVVFYKDLV